MILTQTGDKNQVIALLQLICLFDINKVEVQLEKSLGLF